MKAWHIQAEKREIKPLDIKMAANTVYTFFSSILIDELPSIRDHVIYTDANALAEKKPAYFIGEQLVVGDALIVGVEDMNDTDVTIPQDALASLINYEIPTFYKDVLTMLQETDINLYRSFDVKKGEENVALNIEWVLFTFEIADEATRRFFKDGLQKVIAEKGDVAEFMQHMAQLAMNVANS